MALILKKQSTFGKWYEKHKQRLSEKRKKRYAQDPEYRQRALEASRRHRRGERTVPNHRVRRFPLVKLQSVPG
jgi:hypothetical protein